MSRFTAPALFAALFAVVGCSPSSDKPDVPTVDAFVGKIVADGKPVKFPADDKVELKLFSEKGQQMRIPVTSEGTFQIGWMPIGKYSATLTRDKSASGKGGGQVAHNIPGGLTIEAGKTEYTVELGKSYKP